MSSRFRLHYSFYIVLSSFVILFFNSGARYSIGVIFKPVIVEFGWSRSAISLAFFLHMVVFALSLVLVGRLYDRYGPKWIIVGSGPTACSARFGAGGMGGKSALVSVTVCALTAKKIRNSAASCRGRETGTRFQANREQVRVARRR